MIINRSNLDTLNTVFSAAFAEGLTLAPSQYEKICQMEISTTEENIYPWLGAVSGIREWLGDRVITNLKVHKYTIENRDFESTIGVKRNHIEDDRYGTYGSIFRQMGHQANIHPNQLAFGLLKRGHETPCYDGQYFFDTDHELAGKSVSNNFTPSSGAVAPWYLMCTNQPIKPVIFQKRKDYTFTRMDRETDENVFMRSEFLYGVEARVNVGFGLWQCAVRSTKPLNGESYEEARTAMTTLTNDKGDPLGITPNLLVVSATGEGAARRLLQNQLVGGGNTNEWFGTAELLVSPWL